MNHIVPDLAGWRRSRLAALPDAPALTLAPDWVCEVVSPSTEGIDRGRKLAIYARDGVSHAWLINPASQTLEVLALAEGRWVLLAAHTGAVMVRPAPASPPNPSERLGSKRVSLPRTGRPAPLSVRLS